MRWYIKLFAPVIGGFFLTLLGVVLTITLKPGHEINQAVESILAILIPSWAITQTLFFPKRPEKTRYRNLLLLFIFLAFCNVFIRFFYQDITSTGFIISFYIICCLSTFVYFIRHRVKVYSLAPGWEQTKQLCAKVSLVGWIVFLSLLMETQFFQILRKNNPLYWESETMAFVIMAPWIIALILTCILYYLEAILHHIRSSKKNWQKRIDEIGD